MDGTCGLINPLQPVLDNVDTHLPVLKCLPDLLDGRRQGAEGDPIDLRPGGLNGGGPSGSGCCAPRAPAPCCSAAAVLLLLHLDPSHHISLHVLLVDLDPLEAVFL